MRAGAVDGIFLFRLKEDSQVHPSGACRCHGEADTQVDEILWVSRDFLGTEHQQAAEGDAKYPYLLKDKWMWLPRTRCGLPTSPTSSFPCGMMYLVAIIDVYSRKSLAWRLSNTMDTSFCIDCLEEAIGKVWGAGYFSQRPRFTIYQQYVYRRGGGAWDTHQYDRDWTVYQNIYIERFWRTLKYEEFYLHEYENVKELRKAAKDFMAFYNSGKSAPESGISNTRRGLQLSICGKETRNRGSLMSPKIFKNLSGQRAQYNSLT